jgi:hypothetical protein
MDTTSFPQITTANVYIPSDDGMSDILHNAGHAYAMYLDDSKHDTNEMSIDPPPVFPPSDPTNIE